MLPENRMLMTASMSMAECGAFSCQGRRRTDTMHTRTREGDGSMAGTMGRWMLMDQKNDQWRPWQICLQDSHLILFTIHRLVHQLT